jgi:hypothetical protein
MRPSRNELRRAIKKAKGKAQTGKVFTLVRIIEIITLRMDESHYRFVRAGGNPFDETAEQRIIEELAELKSIFEGLEA